MHTPWLVPSRTTERWARKGNETSPNGPSFGGSYTTVRGQEAGRTCWAAAGEPAEGPGMAARVRRSS